MRNSFTARDIAAFQDSSCASFFGQGAGVAPVPAASDVWCEIAENHGQNMRLWAEEDLARRKRASDSAIAANKRAIDGYNQARNDAIERLDVMLLAGFGGPEAMTGRLHSETPGSIIDRLSIASLKRFHMTLQVMRDDVEQAHREACAERLAWIARQRDDLGACLDELMQECAAGKARFRVYRQFKMYNDPALNMQLVAEGHEPQQMDRA